MLPRTALRTAVPSLTPPSEATPRPLDPGVLILVGFALSLYVDRPLGPITVQEAALVGAVGIAFLHRGQLRLRLAVTLLPLLLAGLGLLAAELGLGLDPETRALTLRLVLIGGAGAIVAPLLGERRYLRAFLWILMLMSCVTAVITLLQSFDVIPFPQETPSLLSRREAEGTSLYRGQGLVDDPNFQALVLSLGLAASLFVRMRIQLRAAAAGLIALGIVATFSRMGLLTIAAIGLTWILIPDPRWSRLRSLGIGVATGLLVVSGILLLNDEVDSEIISGTAARFETTTESLDRFSELGVSGLQEQEQKSSTEKRIVLLSAGWDTALDNWTIGVGPGWVLPHVDYRTGLGQDPHNSYVAVLASVGLPFGLLVLGMWLLAIGLSIVGSLQGQLEDRAVAAVMLAAMLSLFFVNNSFATLFWLPFVLALRNWSGEPTASPVGT